MKPIPVLISFILLPMATMGQAFDLGPNPPSLKWRQINTDKVQVIFPEGNERQGQRVANLAHFLHDSSTTSIGNRPGKISIFIQNQDTRSNGFVSGFPFRSELFVTPPQFNFTGTTDFLDILTIHEYRHVQQFQNTKRGITGLVAKVFGQIGWTAISRLALPRWYWEGDAIVTETALTQSGRGRMPDFTREYWALALEDRFYGYEKATAGSFKDFVPDHWHHGYFMVDHLRTRYSTLVVKEAAQEGVRYKGLFYPFSSSLKRKTGKGTFGIHQEMLRTLSDSLKNKPREVELTNSQLVNTEVKRTFTNYTNPHYLNDETIIVLKAGLDQIPAFYQIDRQGREKKLATPGFSGTYKNRVSLSGSILSWSELTYDERWRNVNYQVINSYHLGTGKKARITTGTKFFSPELSPDGTQYLVVESPENQDVTLSLLDANSGELLRRMPNPERLTYSHPIWAEDGRSVFVVVRRNHLNGIVRIYLDEPKSEWVHELTTKLLMFPVHRENYLFYTASYFDVDNIFAINLKTKEVFQVTNTRLGAQQPDVSPDGTGMVYSEYTVEGYDIRRINLDPGDWTKVASDDRYEDYYPKGIPQFEGGNILNRIPETEFPTQKFRQSNGLINFHSWQPYVIHPEYGFDVVAQNKLTTLAAIAGFRYNANEDFGQFQFDLRYAALYPVINLEAKSPGKRERIYPDVILSDTSAQFALTIREWDEGQVAPGITLPFNLSNDNWLGNLQLNTHYQLLYVNYKEFSDSQADGLLNAGDAELLFSHTIRQAPKHINPRWFQQLEFGYGRTFNTDDKQGEVIQISGRLGFPGLYRNHSTWIAGSYKNEGFQDPYKFVDNFSYARGYPSTFYDDIYRISFNYSLPLWYPDFAIGPLAFLQRIKTNFFFDYSEASLQPIAVEEAGGEFVFANRQFRSAGSEITFNFRFIRLFDFDMGLRYSYLLDAANANRSEHQFDFIILSLGL